MRLGGSHFASAMLGGIVVAAGLTALGIAGRGRTETIVEPAPVVEQSATSPSAGGGSGADGKLSAQSIYQRDAPAVVMVRARLVAPVQSPFSLFHAGRSDTGTGSGFLVDRHGDILTAFHVIDGAERTSGVSVEFEDATIRAANVVAVDPADDLALLHADMSGVAPVTPLALADSSTVRVGDPTLSIGNPFGLDRTLTTGIVSALQHQIQAADGATIDNVIQVDQPVSAAGAGGPLLDSDGRVIGVDSAVATAGDGGQPLAVAVPIDTADALLAQTPRGGAMRVAYLGLGPARAPSGPSGTVVASVNRDGPAAQAGLRRGDRIERVGGIAVSSIAEVMSVVRTRSPGQALAIEVRRGRRLHTLTAVLGSRLASADGR
jgi:S1-C subfamily serine protease